MSSRSGEKTCAARGPADGVGYVRLGEFNSRTADRLAEVLRDLASGGDLILMAEHRLSLIAASDHVVDLGPASGARGGSLVASGPPTSLTEGATAAALKGR